MTIGPKGAFCHFVAALHWRYIGKQSQTMFESSLIDFGSAGLRSWGYLTKIAPAADQNRAGLADACSTRRVNHFRFYPKNFLGVEDGPS